jgi:hypothetical protein
MQSYLYNRPWSPKWLHYLNNRLIDGGGATNVEANHKIPTLTPWALPTVTSEL